MAFDGTPLIGETDDSPSFTKDGLNSRYRHTYTIRAANSSAAYALLIATAPATVTLDGIPLDAPPVYDVQTVNYERGRFTGTVDYRHAARDEQNKDDLVDVGDEKVSFDFGGEMLSGKTAIAQTAYPSASARDVGLAVNVETNGDVTGFEYGSPVGTFSVETVLSEATVTNAWLKARFAQLYTLNDSTFRSLEPGDCRFVGMSGEQRSDGTWAVRFSFEVRIGEDGVTEIGGVSLGTTIRVDGFQYPWVMFDRVNDAADDDVIVPEAIGAYVADIQNESNFALIGVST